MAHFLAFGQASAPKQAHSPIILVSASICGQLAHRSGRPAQALLSGAYFPRGGLVRWRMRTGVAKKPNRSRNWLTRKRSTEKCKGLHPVVNTTKVGGVLAACVM